MPQRGWVLKWLVTLECRLGISLWLIFAQKQKNEEDIRKGIHHPNVPSCFVPLQRGRLGITEASSPIRRASRLIKWHHRLIAGLFRAPLRREGEANPILCLIFSPNKEGSLRLVLNALPGCSNYVLAKKTSYLLPEFQQLPPPQKKKTRGIGYTVGSKEIGFEVQKIAHREKEFADSHNFWAANTISWIAKLLFFSVTAIGSWGKVDGKKQQLAIQVVSVGFVLGGWHVALWQFLPSSSLEPFDQPACPAHSCLRGAKCQAPRLIVVQAQGRGNVMSCPHLPEQLPGLQHLVIARCQQCSAPAWRTPWLFGTFLPPSGCPAWRLAQLSPHGFYHQSHPSSGRLKRINRIF